MNSDNKKTQGQNSEQCNKSECKKECNKSQTKHGQGSTTPFREINEKNQSNGNKSSRGDCGSCK